MLIEDLRSQPTLLLRHEHSSRYQMGVLSGPGTTVWRTHLSPLIIQYPVNMWWKKKKTIAKDTAQNKEYEVIVKAELCSDKMNTTKKIMHEREKNKSFILSGHLRKQIFFYFW